MTVTQPPARGAGRRTPFYGLMVADAISLFGSRMTFVAMPWLVLASTGSATRTGIVAFAETLPYVLANAAGGPLIDRFGPRRMAIALDVASAVVVATIAVAFEAGGLSFGALLALVALAGTLRGLSDTSKRVIFPQAVAHGGVDLTRSTTIHDGLSRAATLIGAPLAALLIELTDAPAVLLFDAASFLVTAAVVAAFVRLPATLTASTSDTDRVPYLRQLADGVGYVRRDPLLLGVVVMVFVTNLLDQAFGTVFVPVWASEVIGSPIGLGLVSAGTAGGAVVGNLAYAWLAPRLPRFAPYLVGFALGGAPRFLALGFEAPLWTVLAICFAAGVGLSVINPIIGAAMYERVPAPLQARVLGLFTAIAWAGIPLGSLIGGWLVDATSVQLALLAFAAVYLLATLLPLTSRAWRQLDDRPEPTPGAALVT